MSDYIIPQALSDLHIYLKALGDEPATFILVTRQDPPEPQVWNTLMDYLSEQPDLEVLVPDYEAGLVTIRTTAEGIHNLLAQPSLYTQLISVSTPAPQAMN